MMPPIQTTPALIDLAVRPKLLEALTLNNHTLKTSAGSITLSDGWLLEGRMIGVTDGEGLIFSAKIAADGHHVVKASRLTDPNPGVGRNVSYSTDLAARAIERILIAGGQGKA